MGHDGDKTSDERHESIVNDPRRSPDDERAPMPRDGAKVAARCMTAILLWGFVLVGAGFLADRWTSAREAARAPRIVEGSDDQAFGLELSADRRGHYVVVGEVNGRGVEMLVDTGASSVAFPEQLARELGLEKGRPGQVETAAGTTKAWRATIDTLRIGPLVRYDVVATITAGMTGNTALLGMSFLRDFDLSQRNGKLVIREPDRKP